MRRIRQFWPQCKTCYIGHLDKGICRNADGCVNCSAYYKNGWYNKPDSEQVNPEARCGCLQEATPGEVQANHCSYYKSLHSIKHVVNKRIRHYWQLYKLYPTRPLKDCYKKPSKYKVSVWNKWANNCWLSSLQAPTVLAYNCHHYTLAFTTPKLFVVVTPAKVLTAKIADLQESC